MLFDGTGSFGLGLGGFDISDFLGLTGSGGIGTITMDAPKIGDYSTVSNYSSPIANTTGQPNFTTSLTANNAGSIIPNTTGQLTNNSLGNYNNILASQMNQGSGSDWLSDVLKVGSLGASIWNDYENRKIQKHALNENIRTNQNKRDRSEKIQKQLTGDPDAQLAGSDYKYI